MTTSNLAICVGPSVLWSDEPQVQMEPNNAKDVSSVMQVRGGGKNLSEGISRRHLKFQTST